MKEFSIIKMNLREEIDDKKMPRVPRDNKLPTWVLNEVELDNRIKKLNKELDNLKELLNRKNSVAPTIIQANISEKAIAKSYRKNINALFSNDKDNILGIHRKKGLLYKIEEKNIDNIEEKIKENFEGYVVSAVENIEIFKPEVNFDDNAEKYKIKLLDFNKFQEVENNFLLKCKDKNININKVKYTDTINIYSTSKSACLDILNDDDLMQFIYEIEPMPVFEATLDSVVANVNLEKLNKEEKEYVNVGILDSGIEELDINRDWILDEKKSCYTEDEINRFHGTMVSTVLLYGDQLIDSPKTDTVPVNLFDATVYGFKDGKGTAEDELILNIKEVISKFHDKIKIWNLSLGSKVSIKEDCFSDFAMVLDELQEKYNILICKSAGNYDGDGSKKICNGADSVLSLVVGSIANKKSFNDLADINTPSPFSRIGRAPARIIKPELVHYGGNCGADYKNATGVKTLDNYGNQRDVGGTSFSTPRVTGIIASIQQKLNSDIIDPILLKALIVHSAKIPLEMNTFEDDDIIEKVGFGIPSNASEILTELESKTTLVLRDKIKKKRYIEILDFPYPKNLSDDTFFNGKVTATLVFKPYLDQMEGIEYCQSDINLEFGTYNMSGEMVNILENEENGIKKENNKNILTKSIYSKKIKMSENYLVQYKNKYYPIKKYTVDLDTMTSANKKQYLTKEKKWYLKLNQLFREKIERKYEGHLEDLEQEFCLIISFEDKTNTKNVHDDVVRELIKNNFTYNDILVENNIEIFENN